MRVTVYAAVARLVRVAGAALDAASVLRPLLVEHIVADVCASPLLFSANNNDTSGAGGSGGGDGGGGNGGVDGGSIGGAGGGGAQRDELPAKRTSELV